jgi:hypothetical protein
MKRGYGPTWLAIGVIGAMLATAPAGCGEGDESIGGVIPGEGFIGRNVELLLVGDNTEWSDDEAVSLGDDVTVIDVSAASPTAILVQASIAASATPGKRDVTVGNLTYEGGFDVVAPIEISARGSLAQGSISVLRVENRDFDHPFDTTSIQPGQHENISIGVGPGIFLDLSSVEQYSLEMIVLVDVLSAAGPRDITILSGPAGNATSFYFPAAFNLEEREATPLTTGQPAIGTIEHPYQSALYSITPDQLSIVDASVAAASPVAAPSMTLLPASGSFGDLIPTTGTATLVTDELHYVVYWDSAGASNYEFHVTGDAKGIADEVPEAEPNNSRAQAVALANTPAVVEKSTLPHEADVDWARLDLTAEHLGDSGKIIHAFTYGEDLLTDTVLTLFRGSNELAHSDDSNFHDELTSEIVTQPGTYFVRVTASDSEFYNPSHSEYGLAIELREP